MVILRVLVGTTIISAFFTCDCPNVFEHSLLDPLTQVYNRSYFEATLAILQKSRKFPISIVVADMDGLKRTNDTLGHAYGDMMLVQASQCLRKACRNEDAVSRIGGDEFGLILVKTDEKAVAGVIKRISHLVEANNKEFSEMKLSLSVGVATSTHPNQLLEDTFRLADKRMYADKQAKRIRF